MAIALRILLVLVLIGLLALILRRRRDPDDAQSTPLFSMHYIFYGIAGLAGLGILVLTAEYITRL